LSPQTISFRWASSAGEKIVENAPVVPTAQTGTYTNDLKVGDDFPTGTVTISVIACSCSDGQGNSGPPMDVNSDTTSHTTDDSTIEIGATTQQPATQELLAAYGVPVVIAIVVILGVLLLIFRRRKKKT
jgi:LPXTG-motif cell wall-anchored protein